MNNRAARFAVAFGIAFLAVPVLAQTEGTVANSTPAPVAYVYVQTNPGVVVYAAAANGTLTPVKGSPFKTTGQMEDISGKILISVGNTILHVYPIESNGAVGKQISETNTASYSGSECGTTSGQGSVLDHTGKYLYVQLSSNGDCAAWQTYQVDSNGHLQFLGDAEYSTQDEYGHLIQSTAPTISSSNKFGYGAFREPYYSGNFCDGVYCPTFSAFTNAGGVLKHNPSFSEKAPEAESGLSFIPWAYTSPRADPYGHIAVLMDQVDEFGNFNGTPLQLASFTINPVSGAISSSNTYSNMPIVQVANSGEGDFPADRPIAMAMSPAGNILAVAGQPGLQLFHFNGAAPPTAFGGLLDNDVDSDFVQVAWDTKDHLYALNLSPGQLIVYTVTPTSSVQAPGSPYDPGPLPFNTPWGVKGIIVVSK
ncbi:MAG: hypothetical protein WBG23_05170 [Acidobacteriaceae bacterium]|jgi:hypothetical protein